MSNDQTRTRFGLVKGIGIVFLCLVSGVIGGGLTRHFGTSSYTLSYADFISIMLTAVSLLMTVLAIFLAVLGFVGWTTIEQKVHNLTDDFLKRGFEKGGPLHQILTEMNNRMYSGIQGIDETTLNGDDVINDSDGDTA
ncbi:hypothetical protein F9288_05715 [Sphingomonas sp. CL5.1]|uniref:hypothetical protein n=1 Tax=Sphingomonas sp. CL5.1 TaxID=2653203 RepID=UPI0015839226|nr:hypothetical protein [Sphingomonas sp. CL5.1]QKR99204.1 hypothetical protein F9288_05715 [Sphingomonas sp. CL5.1]